MTKLKPFHHLMFWGLFLLIPGAYAQESSYGAEGTEKHKGTYYTGEDAKAESMKAEESDTLYSTSPDAFYESPQASEKDCIKEEDEDVLSFNFLYYIIQKFKMSDIVDK